MNKPLNISRLFFLVFVLLLNSFQLALAADISPQTTVDEPCNMAEQHGEMGGSYKAVSHNCCDDTQIPENDCGGHSCPDHGTASTALAVDLATDLKTVLPASGAVDFIPHSLVGRLFPAELRPPRYL